jgi:hypothetical protein
MIEWLKLPQSVLRGLVAVAASMLWGPDRYVDGLGLRAFIEDYRNYLGVVFLILLAATIPSALTLVSRPLKRSWTQRRTLHRLRRRLGDLTEAEKAVLRGYLMRGTRTQRLEMSSGVTRSLEAANIIVLGSNLGYWDFEFDYIIQPWAWQYLREHPELLEAIALEHAAAYANRA